MYLPFIAKELYKRKSRTITNVLTIATAIIILLLISGIMDSYSKAIYEPFKSINSDIILQKNSKIIQKIDSQIRLPFGKAIFSEDEISKISGIKNIQHISKSVIIWNFNKNGFISIEGLEPDSAISKKRATQINEGRYFLNNDENKAIIEKHFAKFNQYKIGNALSIGGKTFAVIGLLNAGEEGQIFASNVYLTESDTHHLLNLEGFNKIYLQIDALSNEDKVTKEIKSINSNISVISSNSIAATLGSTVVIYRKFQIIGIAIILMIMILILFKVNSLNILERRKDIAVMKSVGWTNNEITVQIMNEFLFQTGIGFIVGVLISEIIRIFIGVIKFDIPAGLEQQTISLTVNLPVTMILGYLLIFGLASGITSYFVVRKISSIKPSENLRAV